MPMYFFFLVLIVVVYWGEGHQGSETQNLLVVLGYVKGHSLRRAVLPLQWRLLSQCQREWGPSDPCLQSINLHFPLLLLCWQAGMGIWWKDSFRKGLALDSMLSDVCPNFCDQFLPHRLAVIGVVCSEDHVELLCFIKFSPLVLQITCHVSSISQAPS